jgi:hypothetical protein
MMRLVETFNGVKIEVELTHPDSGSDFRTYVIEDTGTNNGIKTEKWVLNELAKEFCDSYWHGMNVRFLYIIDDEVHTKVYTKEYKEVGFYSELIDELFDDDMDYFEDMMPCDYSGYCSGMNCRNFMNCKGGE